MYFPKGFDIDRAIELGDLVMQAYAQFEAFKNGKPWRLSNDYDLIMELCYPEGTGKNTVKGKGFFDLEIRNFYQKGKRDSENVPIGFIARRKKNVYLIFRGTSTDQEWIRNFMIGLVPYSLKNFGKVHTGFLQTYSLFRPAIKEALEGAHPGRRLFIAGHSLGGALATVALPDIAARMNWNVSAVYTYGSPRIGDKGFVTAFNHHYGKRSFRVINIEDVVGSIPPPVPIAGNIGGYFSHVDTPVDFTIQEEGSEKNHNINTYISALREAKARMGFYDKLKFLRT
jgi:triacylglycerol lipase